MNEFQECNGNFEIGQVLHLKSEIANWTRALRDCSPISNFGFEMQDLSDFEISIGLLRFIHRFSTTAPTGSLSDLDFNAADIFGDDIV